MPRILLVSIVVLVCAGCGASAEPAAKPSPNTSVAQTASGPAQLVVLVVYDQFPAWAYTRYRQLLSPGGALLRTRKSGADHVVEFTHAGTYTAAGHTAIVSGAPPAITGVGSNRVWTAARGNRSVVDDGKHRTLGLSDAFASPSVMNAETVADLLRSKYGDKSKIAALSFKDRGAVLTAGRKPDLALWYEKKLGSMTSSTYYGKALPAWVTEWLSKHPISDYYKDWNVGDAKKLAAMLGPDEAPGEGDYLGFGTTFPYNPKTTMAPSKTFRLTPQSTDYMLDLARASVAKLGMGRDDVPDLLVLSVSSTDYIGHAFGPESWEYVDHLIKVDAAVGAFIAELEKNSRVAVMVTSDHGVARLPESKANTAVKPGRIYPDELPGKLNAAVAKVLGKGKWVGAYVQPFVYFTAAAREADKRPRALSAILDVLRAMPEVHAAYDVRQAAGWRDSTDPLKRLVGRALPNAELGDVFVVPARGSVVDEEFPKGKGTSHGSPWEYDRHVPAVFAGPGVRHTATTKPLDQARVAATLAKLLGVASPKPIAGVTPLPGL